jgi:hypothetical protein
MGSGTKLPTRWRMEIATPDAEREIVWTDIGRHALRLSARLPKSEANAEATALTIDHPGLIDTLDAGTRSSGVSPARDR